MSAGAEKKKKKTNKCPPPSPFLSRAPLCWYFFCLFLDTIRACCTFLDFSDSFSVRLSLSLSFSDRPLRTFARRKERRLETKKKMKLSPLVVVVVALLSLVFVETAFGFYLPGVAPQGASRASSSSSSFLFAAFFFFLSLSLSFREEIPPKATLSARSFAVDREIALFSLAFSLTPYLSLSLSP